MTILSFTSFNEYIDGTVPVTASLTNAPQIALDKVKFIWLANQTLHTLAAEHVPEIDTDARNWLRVRPLATNSTSNRTYVMCLELNDDSIDASLKVPGSRLTISYHFGSMTVLSTNTGSYIGVKAPAATRPASYTANTVFKISSFETRWIDIEICYLEDGTSTVRLLVNRAEVFKWNVAAGHKWGIGTGTMAASLFHGRVQTDGFAYNDFLVTQELPGQVTEEFLGPVKVLPLELNEPVVDGTWRPPAGMTIKQSLENKLQNYVDTWDISKLLITDRYDRKLISTFKAPVEERPILAVREQLLVQKPPTESSSIQYRRMYLGSPAGPVQLHNVDNNNLSHVINFPMTLPEEGEASIDPEGIATMGVQINSVKKSVIKEA